MNKIIVIVADDPSHPIDRGNRARTKSLLDQLLKMKYEIHFILLNSVSVLDDSLYEFWGDRLHIIQRAGGSKRNKRPLYVLINRFFPFLLSLVRFIRKIKRQREPIKWEPKNCDVDSYYHDADIANVVHAIKALSPDVVFLEYIFMSRLFEQLPENIVKVINTHDVFTDRQFRAWENGVRSDWYSVTATEEAKALERANSVISIQEEEAEYFRSITHNTRVVCVGHFQEVHISSRPVSNDPLVLLVGSDNLENVFGFRWFLDEVYPIVNRLVPNVSVQIVGKIKNAFVDVPYESVEFLGVVDDLHGFYDAAHVVVAPLLSGTGLKIKTIEALGHGKPVVATSYGASGLSNYACDALVIEDIPVAFADALSTMLGKQQQYNELCEKAHYLVREMNRASLSEFQSVFEI